MHDILLQKAPKRKLTHEGMMLTKYYYLMKSLQLLIPSLIFFCFLGNPEDFSEALRLLQERVGVIDDDFIKLWEKTEFDKREEMYNNLDIRLIFQTFPNFLHPLGYRLVRFAHYSLDMST